MPDKNMKILVVDDHSTMRRIVRGVLKRLGYSNIDMAENGEEGLDKLRGDKFDFVVCDWNMPVMSGLDMLKAVRSDGELKNLPFLMVTAEAKKDSIVRAIEAGVSNYVVKPFTEEVLAEKIDGIFNG